MLIEGRKMSSQRSVWSAADQMGPSPRMTGMWTTGLGLRPVMAHVFAVLRPNRRRDRPSSAPTMPCGQIMTKMTRAKPTPMKRYSG